MKSRQRTRTVLLALAASIALFWGAVDIVGVPVERLAGQLVWVTLGVLAVASAAALAGWGLSKRRRAGRHSEDR
jgi:uncharacterized membrane protein